MIHVATPTTRPRPADAVLHTLVACHRSAFSDFIRSGGNDATAGEDCEALVRALALTTARTPEGLRAKASVIRDRLLDGTVDALIDDVGADAPDARLILSFAQDALAVALL
jgi:hypothetical protein